MVKVFYPTIGWWMTWGVAVHSMLYSHSQAPDCKVLDCSLNCSRGFITDNEGCPLCHCVPEIETPGKIEVKAGEQRELYCTVAGIENASVVAWHQDDKMYGSAGSYDTNQDGEDDIIVYNNNNTLWILDAKESDAGLYMCVIALEVDNQMYNVTAEFRVYYKDGRVNHGGNQTRAIPVAASASAVSLIVVLLAIVAWYFLVRKQLLKDAEKDKHQRRHSSRRHGSRHGHRSSRHGSVRGESLRQGSIKIKSQQINSDIENGGLTNREQQSLVEQCTCANISADVYDETSHQNKPHTSAKIHPSPEPNLEDDLSPNPSRHSSMSRRSRYSSVAGEESPIIQRHGSQKVRRVESGSPRPHHCCHGEHLNDSPRIRRHSTRRKKPREAFIEDSPPLRRKESRKSHRTSSNASEKGARARNSSYMENCACYACPECHFPSHYHIHQTSPPPVPIDLLPVAASDITVETIDEL